jgi:hypothetical protein
MQIDLINCAEELHLRSRYLNVEYVYRTHSTKTAFVRFKTT